MYHYEKHIISGIFWIISLCDYFFYLRRLDKLKSERLNKRCAKRQRNCKGRKWKHKNVERREDHPSVHLQVTVEVVDLHLDPLWETPCQHLLSLQNQHSIQACKCYSWLFSLIGLSLILVDYNCSILIDKTFFY